MLQNVLSECPYRLHEVICIKLGSQDLQAEESLTSEPVSVFLTAPFHVHLVACHETGCLPERQRKRQK